MHLNRQLGKAINKVRQITAQFRGWMKRGGTGDKTHFWASDAKHGALWSDVTKYAEEKLSPDPVGSGQGNDQSPSGQPAASAGAAPNDAADAITSPWILHPSYEQLQKANEILTDKAVTDTRQECSEKRKIFVDRLKKAGTFFYQWLKADGRRGAVVIKDEDGNPVSYLPTLHEKFRDTWEKIFNMHRDSKPCYEEFEKKYEKYIVKHPGAPSGPPDARQLFLQAQNAKPQSAGGMDGTTPFELKLLPEVAWRSRERYLKLSYQTGKSAAAYYHVSMPLIRKVDKLSPKDQLPTFCDTKDFRLISLLAPLNRVETGAAYRQHMIWMISWFNANMHGGIPNHETAEVSWDVQSDIELALIMKQKLSICLMDYLKFFDSMEPIFMSKLMLATGFQPDFVRLNLDLYQNMKRYIKIGKSYGKPFHSSNGLGQGDSYSLMVALTMVSIQFDFISDQFPKVKMGSAVDDRNIRGSAEDVREAYKAMAEFDKATGHFNNPKKLAMTSTCPKERIKLAKFIVGKDENDEDIHPRIFKTETLVGDYINVGRSPARSQSEKRVEYTFQTAQRVVKCPSGDGLRARAVATLVIPRLLQ
jgi:hypothetical protein